jgi:hypothetical protein
MSLRLFKDKKGISFWIALLVLGVAAGILYFIFVSQTVPAFQSFLKLIGAPTNIVDYSIRLVFLFITGFVASLTYLLIVRIYIGHKVPFSNLNFNEIEGSFFIKLLYVLSRRPLGNALVLSLIYVLLMIIPILNRILEFFTFAWVASFVGWIVSLLLGWIPVLGAYASWIAEIWARAVILLFLFLLITFVPIFLSWVIRAFLSPSEGSLLYQIRKARAEVKAREKIMQAKLGLKSLEGMGREVSGAKKPKSFFGIIWRAIVGDWD